MISNNADLRGGGEHGAPPPGSVVTPRGGGGGGAPPPPPPPHGSLNLPDISEIKAPACCLTQEQTGKQELPQAPKELAFVTRGRNI